MAETGFRPVLLKNVFQLAIVLDEHSQVKPDVIPISIKLTYFRMNTEKTGLFASFTILDGGHGIENFLHVMRFH